MEGQLLIATVAHRYQVAVREGYVPALQPLITLRAKEGMPVVVRRR
jgi:hypothetical protein